jgi:hypothetical protein
VLPVAIGETVWLVVAYVLVYALVGFQGWLWENYLTHPWRSWIRELRGE